MSKPRHTIGIIRVSDLLSTLKDNLDFIEERQSTARGVETYTKLQDKAIAVYDMIGHIRDGQRLIATAPELLEALKDAYAILDILKETPEIFTSEMEHINCLMHMRKAIAKAEGRDE